MKKWISPIPKNIHLIWIGGEPPNYFEKFLKTFHEHLPEFNIKVWGNDDLTKKNFPKTFKYIQKAKKLQGQPMYNSEGRALYDDNMEPLKYSKWAQITDLMRLEIVYNHGGFYFDTTFEILKPMYNLFNKKKYRFYGCNEVPRFKDHYILSNSFFGAVKGSVILKRLLKKEVLDNIDFYDFAVDFQTGPGFLRSAIHLNDNYKILPSYYMYPFVEEYSPGQDPPYRKAGKNKCHKDNLIVFTGKNTKRKSNKRKNTKRKSNKRKSNKRNLLKLANNRGYLDFPCKKYPKSYALKHWQIGKSWLSWLNAQTSHMKLSMGLSTPYEMSIIN